MKLRNHLSTGLVTAVVLATIGTTAAVADNPCWNYRPAERDFARKMNAARSSHGLRKLSLDPELSKVARVHTRDMARKNLLFHTPSSTLAWRVTRWRRLGENVGVDPSGSVDRMHRSFMSSPGHRANILGSFRHVGVGVVREGDTLWVTVVFESRRDPGTRLKMPSC